MTHTLPALLLFTLATWALAVLFLVWARRTPLPALTRLLSGAAPGLAIWLTLTNIATAIVMAPCAWNWLYGFSACTLTSDALPATIVATSALSTNIGAGCTAALAVFGFLWQCRAYGQLLQHTHRRRP